MRIALVGNPNTGKSSIFNLLTGLRQNVGNFPGVTVDKKVGKLKVLGQMYELIDLPGTYSIYPRSRDEQVVYDSLSNLDSSEYPDAVMVVVDASNLERNLLLFSQVYDLGFPTMMVLNMTDIADRQGKKHNIEQLQFMYPEAIIVEANARAGLGKERIKNGLSNLISRTTTSRKLLSVDDFSNQEAETLERFEEIRQGLEKVVSKEERSEVKNKWDKILVHPFFGYVIFGFVLVVIFQFIYAFASIPMDLIDGAFAMWSNWMSNAMPPGVFTDLITQGIIPGVGGIVIFIPQIALLFFFITMLPVTSFKRFASPLSTQRCRNVVLVVGQGR